VLSFTNDSFDLVSFSDVSYRILAIDSFGRLLQPDWASQEIDTGNLAWLQVASVRGWEEGSSEGACASAGPLVRPAADSISTDAAAAAAAGCIYDHVAQ